MKIRAMIAGGRAWRAASWRAPRPPRPAIVAGDCREARGPCSRAVSVEQPPKKDVVGGEGTAALDLGGLPQRRGDGRSSLARRRRREAANEFGATALYAAAEQADPAMAVKLLAAGANPNAALMSGETPLMAAAGRGNLATVRALLAGGADPNAQE